jgi:hypothetical protein
MKSKERKALENKLDKAWSLAVRKGGQCEYEGCGKRDSLAAHHIFGRAHKGTRWDIRNGVCLCYRHHIHLAHRDPAIFNDWIKEKKGQGAWDRLKFKALSTTKFTEEDLKLLLRELQTYVDNPNIGEPSRTVPGWKEELNSRFSIS